jgi:hypothetical protein
MPEIESRRRTDLQRWQLIGELDRWLRWPMIVLALAALRADLSAVIADRRGNKGRE